MPMKYTLTEIQNLRDMLRKLGYKVWEMDAARIIIAAKAEKLV